ncbi:MAG: hypothetical protein IT494_02420 [Gammaproteobacteria bacterium]|nr:hypothetical protein [Gammaproteobacteria bacterium]
MSLLETLLLPRVVGAVLVFAAAAMCEPLLESWLTRLLRGNGAFDWCWERLLSPLLRATLIGALVAALYPALFGLIEAPTLGRLIALGHARVNLLLGALFLLTLVLSALPVISRHPALALPLQGILATAMLFSWLADYLGATNALLVTGWLQLLLLVILAVTSYRIANIGAARLGARLDAAASVSGSQAILRQGLLLLAQGPLIVLYGHTLGRQIAI